MQIPTLMAFVHLSLDQLDWMTGQDKTNLLGFTVPVNISHHPE